MRFPKWLRIPPLVKQQRRYSAHNRPPVKSLVRKTHLTQFLLRSVAPFNILLDRFHNSIVGCIQMCWHEKQEAGSHFLHAS